MERRFAESRWVGTDTENFLPGSEGRETKRAADILRRHSVSDLG